MRTSVRIERKNPVKQRNPIALAMAMANRRAWRESNARVYSRKGRDRRAQEQ